MVKTQSVLAAAALAATLSCGKSDSSQHTSADAKAQQNADGAGTPTQPGQPLPPLHQAAAAGPGEAKAAKHLGFTIKTVSDLYAIGGEAQSPEWGSASSDPAAARDDNLNTTWSCEPGGDKPCALGVSFGEPAAIKAIRLYPAAGPGWGKYIGSPRPKTVRLHTDEGFYETELGDGARHQYIILDSTVRTTTATVEFVDGYEGKKDKVFHVAEIEIYGDAGPSRPVLDLDPAMAYVTFDTDAWKNATKGATIRQPFIAFLGTEGNARLMRGTAMFGNKGDRYLLVEKLFATDCSEYRGSYVLLDQHTRMVYPLGPMGGMGGDVYRRDDGLGFFIHQGTADAGQQRGVTLDDDTLAIRRPKSADDPKAGRAGWGFTAETPEGRGGRSFGNPPEFCVRGDTEGTDLSALDSIDGMSDVDPSAMLVCELEGGVKAVMGRAQTCAKNWVIALVGADGAVTQSLKSKVDEGRDLWLARVPGLGLMVEAPRKNGNATDLFKVSVKGIEVFERGAGFAVRAPAPCNACDGRLFTDAPTDKDGTAPADAPTKKAPPKKAPPKDEPKTVAG